METLNKHAAKKTTIFFDNHKPHANKALRSVIMEQSALTMVTVNKSLGKNRSVLRILSNIYSGRFCENS